MNAQIDQPCILCDHYGEGEGCEKLKAEVCPVTGEEKLVFYTSAREREACKFEQVQRQVKINELEVTKCAMKNELAAMLELRKAISKKQWIIHAALAAFLVLAICLYFLIDEVQIWLPLTVSILWGLFDYFGYCNYKCIRGLELFLSDDERAWQVFIYRLDPFRTTALIPKSRLTEIHLMNEQIGFLRKGLLDRSPIEQSSMLSINEIEREGDSV